MRHGGDISDACARFGHPRESWLDLSTGINPHAYPLATDLASTTSRMLPNAEDLSALLSAASACYGVPRTATVVAAPGTQAIIQWLPRLVDDAPVAVVSPTYGEHSLTWRAAGFSVVECDGLDDVPAEARIVVAGHPNNPTGDLLDREQVARMLADLGRRDGIMIVDEAFVDTNPDASMIGLAEDGPIYVLRSFGKFFGLAGVRLGFLIGRGDLPDRLNEALGPWAVSGLAIAAGIEALSDHAWQHAMRMRLAIEAERLDGAAGDAGLRLIGGTSLFRLYNTKNAVALHFQLASRAIWTRIFDYDPNAIRLGLPGSEQDLRRLSEALAGDWAKDA